MLALDTKAVGAQQLPQAPVARARISDKLGLGHVQTASLVQHAFIYLYGDHFAQKQVMRAERQHLRDLALDVDRALGDEYGLDGLSWHGGEAGCPELVYLPAGNGTAVVRDADQIHGWQVDRELTLLLDQLA